MKCLPVIIALCVASAANAATYITAVSAGTNPASGNTMDREKVVKLHLMPPTTAGQTFNYLRWNGETSGSWQGGSATINISYGQPEVVITTSAKTMGLLPWGAGESAGWRYTRRLQPSSTDLESQGFTFQAGPFDATAGNGDYPGWGWDASEVTANTVHVYFGGAAPIKHPEPLNLIIKNNDAASVLFKVTNPAGTVVYQGGVGPKATYTGGWDPPDNAVEGVYKLLIVQTKKAPNGEWQVTTYDLSAQTLSAANAIGLKDMYSKAWADHDLKGTIPGQAENPGDDGTGNGGSITNNSGGSRTLSWKDELGNTVGSVTLANGEAMALDPRLDGVATPGPGQSKTLTLVDNTTGKSLGNVTLWNPGDDQPVQVGGGLSINIPPASSTATANNGTTTNTGTPGNTANPPNTATTVMTGGSGTTLTKQDFYEVVRQANIDAGNTTSGGGASPGSMIWGDGDTPGLPDIQAAIDGKNTQKTALKDGILGKLSSLGNSLNNVPTSLATVDVVTIGTMTTGGHSFGAAFDFTKVAGGISLARQLMYWVLTLLFVLKCAQTIGDTFGSAKES